MFIPNIQINRSFSWISRDCVDGAYVPSWARWWIDHPATVRSCSFTDKMWQSSVVPSAAVLPLIQSVTCQTQRLCSFCWFLHNGLTNLMHLKPKGRESGLLSCTWTCAPDGMGLFASCILSKAPKSVSYVQEGLLDCSVRAFSFHMIVSTSFSDVLLFFLDLSGFKNPSGWNMNLESHTFKTEN